ncbi:sensor histidine kinase [Prevotella melaninogenica]|uniref:ATP-binding protein n=1 Tax=Prevotella melaninogenica TaxID=28132 RepID=UPI001BA87F72|nr:sensor histidine kinase [Prevotella melaninogenica]QUB67591.1 sensor histidine kinase [Prevotella melaninogenica]
MEVPFAISARAAKLIGMENFANAEGAVVELVKNGYDADADICVVVVDIRQTASESRLYIIDNGCGMTSETIVKHWMTIGTNDKLVNERTKGKNRIKSGAKGIGRFALNRLGRKAEMITFTDSKGGWLWSVDWLSFERANVLSDIKATLDPISIEEAKRKISNFGLDRLPITDWFVEKCFHGTILCISDLIDEWEETNLNSLQKNLENLIPEHVHSVFGLYLFNMQDLTWGGKINPAEYDEFDYKVTAKYEGGRTINVNIERNELNVSLLETNYSRVFTRKDMQKEPYRIKDFHKKTVGHVLTVNDNVKQELLDKVGSFTFSFYFIKNSTQDERDKDGLKKYPYNIVDSSYRKAWLSKFGGVRIFRDDFRVRPYGENGNDWLDLGRRQAQSPGGAGQKLGGYRIRPNQIAGVVNISRINNPSFEDKSSREGIQENDAFALFKNLLLKIISVFEIDRNYIMYNLSEQYKVEHPVEQRAKDIVKKALQYNEEQSEKNKDIKILASSYQSLEQELEDKEKELAMIRSLASMGISVATFNHELRSIMLRLLPRNELLRSILMKNLPVERFEGQRFGNPYKELDIMKGEDEKLYNWLQYSLHSIQRNKRDKKKIYLSDYFQRFTESWHPTLSKKNISIELKLNGIDKAAVNAIEMDLDSVYNNFVANSINAFLKSREESKRININVFNDHGYVVVDFIDNGCGLSPEYQNNPDVIFNAFETSTVDNKNNKIGTGMGLFIAKGVIEKIPDSSIALLSVKKGFGIRTIIKIK